MHQQPLLCPAAMRCMAKAPGSPAGLLHHLNHLCRQERCSPHCAVPPGMLLVPFQVPGSWQDSWQGQGWRLAPAPGAAASVFQDSLLFVLQQLETK